MKVSALSIASLVATLLDASIKEVEAQSTCATAVALCNTMSTTPVTVTAMHDSSSTLGFVPGTGCFCSICQATDPAVFFTFEGDGTMLRVEDFCAQNGGGNRILFAAPSATCATLATAGCADSVGSGMCAQPSFFRDFTPAVGTNIIYATFGGGRTGDTAQFQLFDSNGNYFSDDPAQCPTPAPVAAPVAAPGTAPAPAPAFSIELVLIIITGVLAAIATVFFCHR